MRSPARKGLVTRHIPQRTCVSCRQTTGKRQLVRVVRLPGGRIQLDATGKKSGRGAYLCNNRRCWESALAKGALEHALKAHLCPEDRIALEAHLRNLPQGAVGAGAPSPAKGSHES